MDSESEGADAPQSLLEWRKARGLLQEEAGDLIGVSKVSWGNWEMGRKPPRPAHLARLSSLTGLSYEQILNRAGDRPHARPAGATLPGEEADRSSPGPLRKAG
jgi:transcriptional regulator with XRE-family HTH domain